MVLVHTIQLFSFENSFDLEPFKAFKEGHTARALEKDY